MSAPTRNWMWVDSRKGVWPWVRWISFKESLKDGLKWVYSWPFISLYLLVLQPLIQSTTDCVLCLWSLVEPVDTEPMNVEGWLTCLSFHRFWYPRGVLEPIPCEYWETTVITNTLRSWENECFSPGGKIWVARNTIYYTQTHLGALVKLLKTNFKENIFNAIWVKRSLHLRETDLWLNSH